MDFDDIKHGTYFRIGYDVGVWIPVQALRVMSDGGWLCMDNKGKPWRVYRDTPIKPPIKRRKK